MKKQKSTETTTIASETQPPLALAPAFEEQANDQLSTSSAQEDHHSHLDRDDNNEENGRATTTVITNSSNSLPLLEARAVSEDVLQANVLTGVDVENRFDIAQQDRDTLVIRDENEKLRRRQKIIIVCAVVLAAVVVALVVGFVVSDSGDGGADETPLETAIPTTAPTVKQTSPPTSQPPTSQPTTSQPTKNPTEHPTPAPTDRLEGIIGILSGAFGEPFPSSDLQEEALLWLVYNDPAYLPIDTTDPDHLLERFILVLLYLSTEPIDSRGTWLNGASVCAWDGIICNTDEQVTTLEPCK